MKKVKKLLSALVCMAMLCAVLPCVTVGAATSGTCGDNLTWTLDSKGTLTISGTGDMEDWYWDASPWYSSDKINSIIIKNDVTTIGNWAFWGCSGLTSVTIPDSVTSIGSHAFENCTGLTSVSIPDSVTSIGDDTFFGCDSLTSINVNDENQNYTDHNGVLFTKDVTVLVQYPIGNSRTEYNIPDGVTTIGRMAFYNCIELTNVTIPIGVTRIGESAFAGCESLTNIEVDSANTSYASVDGVLFDKDITKLIRCPIGNPRTEYNIPNSVTSIGEGAFASCDRLTSITIPDSLTTICDWAFGGCTGLTSVTIPDSVTSIGNFAFWACTGLTSVTIGNGVTSIGEGAFCYCESLTSVNIGSGVTTIGKAAFNGCIDLSDVYYAGSEEDWNAISIDYGNGSLTGATIHYNSTGPESAITVIVDGTPIAFDVNPIIIEGSTMLPVRKALEPLGAEFEWDGNAQTVTVNNKGKVIVLTIGSDTALIDGAEKKMAKPAVIIDGRTLIPIRFVAEELGYNVSWDNETKTVRINSAD